MITKIERLKDFGVFQNFSWDDLGAFGKKNLIYGWNYSGKTTLSKLFQILKERERTKYFPAAEYKIEYQARDGSIRCVSQDNLADFPFKVRIFNSEYIKEVFVWDEPKSSINPISFYLGDEAGEIKAQLQKLQTFNERLASIQKNRYEPLVEGFNQFEKINGIFATKATDIRENYLAGVLDSRKFHKGSIKEITDRIKNDLTSYILANEERDKVKSQAIAQKRHEPISTNFIIKENLLDIAKSVKGILEETAPRTIPMPSLEESQELFEWVQKGIHFHDDARNCKFCEQPLPEKRLDNLNAFYSKRLNEIQESLKEVGKKIEEENKIIQIDFPSKLSLVEHLRNEYEVAIKNYYNEADAYSKQLDILSKDLKSKESQIFSSIKASDILEVSLKTCFEEVIEVINKHNNWLNEFEKRKQEVINKILNHYVAELLVSENYLKKEAEKEYALGIITKIDILMAGYEEEINHLRAQLSQIAKGQEELNFILEILLHRNDIRIEIKEERFRLERAGHPATSLSEGEKSAIAFAYFLTELKSLRNDDPPQLPNTIVFIDDPISSLDSNHIFQIRSLLKDFFKSDDFAQLFISTHNFEFFSVLMDSNLFGRIQANTNESKRPLFFIRRDKAGYSDILKMPKSFSSYKSEYVGLFQIIKEYNESENKEQFPYLILLPNAVRRFIELYTLMRYPSSSELDQRVEQVFKMTDKPAHNTKLLHWFSHQNQFEKVQQHDDKMFQIDNAIEDLLNHIKDNDEMHWNGLNGI